MSQLFHIIMKTVSAKNQQIISLLALYKCVVNKILIKTTEPNLRKIGLIYDNYFFDSRQGYYFFTVSTIDYKICQLLHNNYM